MNDVPDYRWIKWLSWVITAVIVIMLVRNILEHGTLNFSTVEWGMLVVGVAADIVLWLLKRKLENNQG
ncbi:MAG: hypothetical protein FWB91_02450 [Defluviitaleaceae bacterium]|nr:hypothetical protein [Defluviitaleaceae bacterium]